MLGSFLRAAGIGSAKIDTILSPASCAPGETLTGKIVITGGSGKQSFRGINLELNCRCYAEIKDERKLMDIVVASASIPAVDVAANAVVEIPFAMQIPLHAPLSAGGIKNAIKTRLDIEMGVDSTDSDAVNIVPTAEMAKVFEAAEILGLKLKESEVEYNARRDFPFVQEFDYRPGNSGFRAKEIELSLKPTKTTVQVDITVDQKDRLFSKGAEKRKKIIVKKETTVQEIVTLLKTNINSMV